MTNDKRKLTMVQSKILIALFPFGGNFVSNENILKESEISRSTWSEEQYELLRLGLIEKKYCRVIKEKSVHRSVNYRLTKSGRAIAHNLMNISRILNSIETHTPSIPEAVHLYTPHGLDGKFSADEHDFLDYIRESIEVALEGFGMNFLMDARAVLEIELGIPWQEIARNTDKLLLVLMSFFGAEGAKTVESMICANVRARFGLQIPLEDNLQNLVEATLQLAQDELAKHAVTSKMHKPDER